MAKSGRIHLSGAGWIEDEAAVYGPFVADATEVAAGTRPMLGVVLWAATAAEGEHWHQQYVNDFRRIADCDVQIVQLTADTPLTAGALSSFHGIVVGGGSTPGYHEAIMPIAEEIRQTVRSGVPYCGISAGAMITPAHALIGGSSIGGRAVTPESSSEGLSEITIRPGLGLVDRPVDVHVAQFGNLGRVVALVELGLADRAIGIDENTVVIVDGDQFLVAGTGRAWFVERTEAGAVCVQSRTGE